MEKITYKEIELKLTENAYLMFDVERNKSFYCANAIDKNGEVYEVFWNILIDKIEDEDESEVCNWEKPIRVMNENWEEI